jgi:predicted nucleic acid-binding protein
MKCEMIPPTNDPIKLLDMIRSYRLLPADAAIAASCKCHDMRKIAAIDSDLNE